MSENENRKMREMKKKTGGIIRKEDKVRDKQEDHMEEKGDEETTKKNETERKRE